MTTLRMTVQSIEAQLIDVTTPASDAAYMVGRTWVTAVSGSHSHRWALQAGERCWIGDVVEVEVRPRFTPGSTSLRPPPPLLIESTNGEPT